MALKRYKATTNPRRQRVMIDRSGFAKKTAAPKRLLAPAKKVTGRNNQGRVTVRHRGGGQKRMYRVIDFNRNKFDIPGKVVSLEFDPNRTGAIALVTYADGDKRFILAPAGLEVGMSVVSSRKEVSIDPGNATLLKNIPSGFNVHNVEMYPGQGAKLGRSAGNSLQVQGQVGKYVQVKMPSGEVRLIHGDCLATIGAVSNEDHLHEVIGSAGVNRRLGRRPTVRGVAMHAQQHPHGGGEGKTGTGGPAKDIYGHRVGVRTGANKRTKKFILKRRTK
ncbi:MAG: 50S ribosomal protein L2 [Candidatus Dojkabacteria bacterium]|nr:MAG: 50S ribosomal protein L2 [Candidatus Dojkabacteria bacterium]